MKANLAQNDQAATRKCDYCVFWPWSDPGQCCAAGQVAMARDEARVDAETWKKSFRQAQERADEAEREIARLRALIKDCRGLALGMLAEDPPIGSQP